MNAVAGRALAVSAVVAALGPTAPRAARADEVYLSHMPPPPPAGGPASEVVTIEERNPNGKLIGSGVTMLGLAYGASVLVAATSGRPSDQNLYIPVAGPWIDLTHRGSSCPECAGAEAQSRVLLVANGIFQAAGALQILGGFLFPETRTVTRTVGVHVAPTAGWGSVGVTAYGAF